MEVGKSTGYIIHGWVWVGMEIWYITLYRVGGIRGSQKMIIFRYIIGAYVHGPKLVDVTVFPTAL